MNKKVAPTTTAKDGKGVNGYEKPKMRIQILQYDHSFCLSDVTGAGGSISDWKEDDESPFK